MVKRVFTLVYKEVRGLHQAAYVLALFAFGSQLLAVIRDRMLAHTFGAGEQLDLYYAAFRIPDLLFVLFASVLSVYVLLPFADKAKEKRESKSGENVLSQIFSLFLVVYVLMAGLLALLAPWYVPKMFPGFDNSVDLLVSILRILLLQPFLLGLSSLCSVVTQMNRRFILYAISPLLYNLGIIFGIAFLYPVFGLSGLAYGVVLGALGHLGVQLPFVLKSEYRFRLTKRINWRLIKEIVLVSIPRALTLSVNQLVLLVLVGLASLMTAGSVSIFQFAFNLQSVPLAIIGMSYSVAAFPTLSSLFSKSDHAGFNRQLITAMRHIIFWSLPIAGLIIVLRAQIVRVLLGSGAFDWSDTRLTAAILAVFVISLVAQALLLLLIRAFYASGRTLLPLLTAVISAVGAIVLAFILKSLFEANPLLQNSLASLLRLDNLAGSEVLVLAFSYIFGQFIQLFLLLLLAVKIFTINYRPLLRLLLEAVGAALFGGVAAYVTLEFMVNGINQETFVGILTQGLAAGVMGMVGVILAYALMGASELKEIYRSFKGKIRRSAIIAPQEE